MPKRERWTLLLLVLAIGIWARPAEADSVDERLFRYVHEELRSPGLDLLTDLANPLGDSRWVLGASLGVWAVGAALERPDLRDDGKLLVGGFLASASVVYTAKRVIARARPLNPEETTSMPSGHAAIAATAATILGERHPRWRLPLYSLAAATAFARVYRGRHYPSDVLVGLAVGYGIGRLIVGRSATLLAIRF